MALHYLCTLNFSRHFDGLNILPSEHRFYVLKCFTCHMPHKEITRALETKRRMYKFNKVWIYAWVC